MAKQSKARVLTHGQVWTALDRLSQRARVPAPGRPQKTRPAPPPTQSQVWTALARLAERAGLSPSGLAKKSGLDPTTFNKSKRVAVDGRERWPSTESVAKALGAPGRSVDSFVPL